MLSLVSFAWSIARAPDIFYIFAYRVHSVHFCVFKFLINSNDVHRLWGNSKKIYAVLRKLSFDAEDQGDWLREIRNVFSVFTGRMFFNRCYRRTRYLVLISCNLGAAISTTATRAIVQLSSRPVSTKPLVVRRILSSMGNISKQRHRW